jgi:hypothetical protein
VGKFTEFKAAFAASTNAFDVIETNYAAANNVKKSAIRQKALDLGLISNPVADEKFIKVLRRSVDAADPVMTQKFQTLAGFSASTP